MTHTHYLEKVMKTVVDVKDRFIELLMVTAMMATLAVAASPSAAERGAAAAAGVDAVQGLNLVREQAVHVAVEGFIRSRLEGKVDPAERFEVGVRWQGDILLDAPLGRLEFKLKPISTGSFRGPTVVRLEILVDKVTEKTLTLTADTRFYREVLVTTRSIRRGSLLTDDMVELVERDVTKLRFGYFTKPSDLRGMQARRPVGFGDILNEEHAELIPLVKRGDGVIMTARSQNMLISAQGVALQNGGIGEQIRVKNTDSGKTILARVLEDGSVMAGL